MPVDCEDVVVDDRGFVARDIACPRCGHNLRGLQPSAHCSECNFSVDRALEIWKSKAYWTSWRRVIALVSSLSVLVVLGLNYLVVGPPELGPADLMPHEATGLFKRLWGASIVFWILTLLALIRMRRVPVLLWVIVGSALLVSMLGLVVNEIIELIIFASV